MSETVADTGPLIHLDEIDEARALGIFTRVIVPEPVAAELKVEPRRPGASMLKRDNVEVVPLSRTERDSAMRMRQILSFGVADCAALAMARRRSVVLLADDLDLRDAAASYGVKPVGTIGVVIRAATTGVLTAKEARDALDALLASSSLFITRPLIDRAKVSLSDR